VPPIVQIFRYSHIAIKRHIFGHINRDALAPEAIAQRRQIRQPSRDQTLAEETAKIRMVVVLPAPFGQEPHDFTCADFEIQILMAG
jgi:hypothetical protein